MYAHHLVQIFSVKHKTAKVKFFKNVTIINTKLFKAKNISSMIAN